jgi:serine/threonine protein kinase/tetratricopeptide (TPR) repeat protein
MNQQIIANRYSLIKLIGRGGMGDVYEATDQQTNSIVAVKSLKPDIVEFEPGLVERFIREGEILRKLNHPNIVTILDAVEENERHYIILEYVAGGSLKELIENEAPLSPQRTVEIALDLADALTRAHRLNVIHRDIKPANVLIAKDGTPRLTDFGIAHMPDKEKLTNTGSIMGTYAYLSPEACTGEELDRRTDIWAFGVMLYEMLSSKHPFIGNSDYAALIAIMQNPHPPITTYRPDIPPALVTLINQMLVKDREQRISSIRRIGAELESILYERPPIDSDDELTFPPVSTEQPASRFATPTPSSIPNLSATADQSQQDSESIHIIIRKPKRGQFIGTIVGIGFLVAILVVGIFLSGLFDSDDSTPSSSANSVPVVTSGNTDEYAVLVAQLLPIGSVIERPISDILVENLHDELGRANYLSEIRIYNYPEIITSSEDAKTAAKANGATVIIWGRYDQDEIILNIQVGSSKQFANLVIPLETVEETVNVRVRLENENRQSVAPQVLGVLSGLQSAEGNGVETMRVLAIMDDLDVNSAEMIGNTVPAYFHRYLTLYFNDPDAALVEINAAHDLDPTNPLLYIFRGGLYMRLGEYDLANQDAGSAQGFDASWAFPIYMEASYELSLGEIDNAIEKYGDIIALNPNDWFSFNFRAALYYIKGDYVSAKADYERAIELGPTANFPYPFLVMLALRDGDIPEVQRLMHEVRTDFGDPSIGNRTINAAYGDTFSIPFGPWMSAFGNIVLGQFDDVLADVDSVPETQRRQFPELYLLQGLAYCNQQKYDEALASYTTAIELDRTITILYLLRGEIALRLEDNEQVAADTAIILESDLSDTLTPYLQAGINGDLSCENFFTYQLNEID